MEKESVLQLRYLGTIPQDGHIEYGFRIEYKDKSVRQVILTIEDAFFRNNDLKIQEAPDLCYQKVLSGLGDAHDNGPVPSQVQVTASDIAHYRNLHPTVKLRKSQHREIKSL